LECSPKIAAGVLALTYVSIVAAAQLQFLPAPSADLLAATQGRRESPADRPEAAASDVDVLFGTASIRTDRQKTEAIKSLHDQSIDL